ncbi:hypothetical protein FRB95_014256 [Tulasnella sp. JGI-2019a]|nr:hypothetical protein FRB95_014256 [Tulasnella sp. JGI-2019a]
MHTTTRPPSPPPDSGWQSIRPYTPKLALTTCEITSASATFVLRSSLDATYLKKPGTETDAEGGDADGGDAVVTVGDEIHSSGSGQKGIAEVLRPGLVVKVNDEPWKKVVITKDEEEEAIVTLYDLDPATYYEIDLFVASGEDGFSGSIVTASLPAESAYDEPQELQQQQTPEPTMPGISAPFQTLTPEFTPPATPRLRSPSPPPPRLITAEERIAQLKSSLAASIAERDSLQTQVRLSRKEAQRADTAIRSEIETLKRAAEKNATVEVRNKQKLLALQQSVKHLIFATEGVEEQNRALTEAVPELETREKAVSEDHTRVKEEMERSATETEATLKAEKKRVADLEEEMAGLDKELERLNVLKNKLHDDQLPSLESQLAALAKEIDAVEKGSAVHLPMDFAQEVNANNHTQYYPNPSPGSASMYPNPNQNQNHRMPPPRNTRPPPIQRPQHTGGTMLGNGNPHFSASQRSFESIEPPWNSHGPYSPQNAPPSLLPGGSFPQIRHPSLTSHPAPRGLFVNNPGFQRGPPAQSGRSSELDGKSRMSSSSSSVNQQTGWLKQNEHNIGNNMNGHSAERLVQLAGDRQPPPMRRPSGQLVASPEQNRGSG